MHAQILALLLAMTTLLKAQNLRTSTSGSCAGTTGETCLGSRWGDCCSTNSFCGQNATYCGAGCQTGFGACYENANLISSDGSCGVNGTTCVGSIFGNCCSQTGFCGSSSLYCGAGCQNAFGECGDAAATKSISAVAASTSGSTSITPGTTSTSSVPVSSTIPSSTVRSSSIPTATMVPSRPITSTAGFKAGMAVMALVIAALIGTLLLWFFVYRHGPSQSRSTNGTDCNLAQNQFVSKPELECSTASASMSTSASELGGAYIAELPARHSYKRGLVDERGLVGHNDIYRGY